MFRLGIFLASAIFAAAAPDQKPLEDWIRKQSGIRSIETNFVQERRLATLEKPVTAKGRFWFRHPGFLRWELGQPPSSIAISDGKTLTIVDTAEKRAHRLPADHPKAHHFTLLAGEAFRDVETFRRSFELHDSQTTGPIYQAILRPLDRRLRANVPWIILDIDTRNYQLRAFDMQLRDKTRIRSVFSDTRIDASIPDSRFQYDLTGYKVR